MTLVILIIGCIALTIGLAALITCINDAISLEHGIREHDPHNPHKRPETDEEAR